MKSDAWQITEIITDGRPTNRQAGRVSEILETWSVHELVHQYKQGNAIPLNAAQAGRLARAYDLTVFGNVTDQQDKINGPEAVARFCKDLRLLPYEVLRAIGIDAHNNVIGTWEIQGWSTGVNATTLQIIRFLVKIDAPRFAIAHNHPSGSPEPSREDVNFTKHIRNAAETVEIAYLDHVIIGKVTAYSMNQFKGFEIWRS